MAEVPDLPCRKCGHVTAMRYCWPAPWDWWGRGWPTCSESGEHLHRECGRCGFRWVTRDVLPDPEFRIARFEQLADWWAKKGEPRLAESARQMLAAERAGAGSAVRALLTDPDED